MLVSLKRATKEVLQRRAESFSYFPTAFRTELSKLNQTFFHYWESRNTYQSDKKHVPHIWVVYAMYKSQFQEHICDMRCASWSKLSSEGETEHLQVPNAHSFRTDVCFQSLNQLILKTTIARTYILGVEIRWKHFWLFVNRYSADMRCLWKRRQWQMVALTKNATRENAHWSASEEALTTTV